MLVDSHCHLNYLDAPDERLASARRLGVEGFLCVGVDEAHIGDVLGLADRHPDVWATVGQHPDAAGNSLEYVEPLVDHPKVVAIGETGLDYMHASDAAERARQRAAFDAQLAIGVRCGLPVVVHTREAEGDTLDLLRAHPATGVLHCFTESLRLADAALDLGYYVSISGIVTFRNAENVREVARHIPADRLLVETDCPWLAPVPHRGEANEPAFVTHTARFLAELRGVSADVLAAQTTANFRDLFGL